jgi:hypothetical protein
VDELDAVSECEVIGCEVNGAVWPEIISLKRQKGMHLRNMFHVFTAIQTIWNICIHE